MNTNLNPLLTQQFMNNNTNSNNGLWAQQNNISHINNLLPHYEVIQVSGENGADAFQMGPNSSILLADSTAPIIWLVKTDGAGYKTKIPYDVLPHQNAPAPDYNKLEERIARLEEMYAAKSQSNSKQSRKQPASTRESGMDATN